MAENDASVDSQDRGKILERYSRHVFTGADGKKLNYRMMQPRHFDSKQIYPLVIFMHGAGERGSDNETHLAHGAKDLASDQNTRSYPCFALFPQCPEDEQWVNTDWRELSHTTPDEPSTSMASLMQLIDEVILQQPIDCDRIYVTGLSMGGFGVFDLVTRRPNMFAAAAPLCGGGDASPEIADRLAKVPMWIVHGDKDGAVNVSRSRQMVKAIKTAGGDPIYDELAGVGHNVWTKNYANPKFYQWMFAQSLSGSEKPSVRNPTSSIASVDAAEKAIAQPTKISKSAKGRAKQVNPIRTQQRPITKSTPEKSIMSPRAKKDTAETSKRVQNEIAKSRSVVESQSVKQANLELPDPFSGATSEDRSQTTNRKPPAPMTKLQTKSDSSQTEAKDSAGNKAFDVSKEAGSFEDAFEKMEQEELVGATPNALQGIEEKDLEGTWKAVVARYKGSPMPQANLDKMEFTFDSGTMNIVQNVGSSSKSQSGKLILGDVVKTDLVVARSIDFAPPKKNGPPIKGLFYFEGEQLVLLLNGPGEPRPASFRDAKKGRLLVLERN